MTRFKPKRKLAKSSGKNLWAYEDPKEHALAMKGLILGFDLVEFDTWLMQLEECGAKKELIARRQAAVDAENPTILKAYLEFINVQWYLIKREEFLLPLAVKGKKSGADTISANRKSIKTRQAKADELSESILMLYNTMSAEFEKKDRTLLYSHVIREYEKQFGVKITDYKIRKAIAKTKSKN